MVGGADEVPARVEDDALQLAEVRDDADLPDVDGGREEGEADEEDDQRDAERGREEGEGGAGGEIVTHPRMIGV